jgi:WD40 repeat protein
MKKIVVAIFLFSISFELIAQKAELAIPKGHARGVNIFASSADEKILFSYSDASDSQGEIKIWDIPSGRLIRTLTENVAWGTQIVGIPNQQSVGFCGFNTGKLYIASAPTFQPKLLATLPYGFTCKSIVALPDGQNVLLSGSHFEGQFRCPFIYKVNLNNGSFIVFNKMSPYTTDTKVLAEYNLLEITDNGRYLLAYATSTSTEQPPQPYHLLDASTGAVVRSFATPSSSYSIMGNGLLKRTSKPIGNNQYETTRTPVTLPDFTEGKPFVFQKPTGYIWKQAGYFYDEIEKTYTYITSEDRSNFNIVKISTATGKIILSYMTDAEAKGCVASAFYYLPKSKKVVSEFSTPQLGSGIHILDGKTLKKEVVLGNIVPYTGNTIAYNPKTDAFVANSGSLKIFELGKTSGIPKVHNIFLESIQYVGKEGFANWSPDGSKLAYFDKAKKEIGVFDANNLTAKPKTGTFSLNTALRSPLIWTNDSKKFTFGQLNSFIETDANTLLATPRYISRADYQSDYHLFSKNGQYVIQPAYKYEGANRYVGEEINYLICYNAASGAKVWESTYKSKVGLLPISFIDNDKTLVAIEGVSGTLQYFDVATGQNIGSFGEPMQGVSANALFNSLILSTSISADGNKCVVWGSNKINIYDFKTKTKVAELPEFSATPNGVSFLRNDKYLAYTTVGAIKIVNIELKREVATLTLFSNSNEWVVATPDGRFDASQAAQEFMYYVKEGQIIPLSSLFEKFYTPKLLNRLLEGETFEPVPVNVDNIKAPPTVNISVDNTSRNLVVEDDIVSLTVEKDQINLLVKADCPSDAVTEIRLYNNGKLVQTSRNLVVEEESVGEKTMTKMFTVSLEAGENEFKALAFNTQRTESQPAKLTVNYQPPKTSNIVNKRNEGVNLHLLVIGIDKYKNPKYNLNYAIADAAGFKEAIEKGGTGIFTKTNIVFMNNENATKANITAELDKIKTNATANDVFIFYYAGHGVMNDKKEFYLVPHDVTQLYGADESLAQKGLSSGQLQQFSKDIKAQKQLFILDACQSAGALEILAAARGAAEEKAIAQLARSTGTHWLTASGSEQFASEFSQLGHGTFTYVLLEALSGKADTGDKKITVKEIDFYLQEQVPEVTSKYKGTPQYPASYGYGNDFPLIIMK